MGIAMLLGTFVVLLLIGVPVAYALGAAALATLLYLDLPTVVLVQQISAGSGSASLIAIPLFIFAGELMLRGGISERLIALASSLVGRVRGGLGQVSVLSSLFFGGVSGSAIADVSAVGGTMIPQMIKRGYDRDYAVNVSMTAALVALLVPPSRRRATDSVPGRASGSSQNSRPSHESRVAGGCLFIEAPLMAPLQFSSNGSFSVVPARSAGISSRRLHACGTRPRRTTPSGCASGRRPGSCQRNR